MTESSRRIFSGGRTTHADLTEALQWLFLAELLAPGDTVWIAAPSIDNAPILDNSTGAFDALDPAWHSRTVRLLDLVLRLAGGGTRVVLATRAAASESAFLKDLRAVATDHGLEARVVVRATPWLPISGILTRHAVVRGALAFEADTVRLLDEAVTLETGVDELAAARAIFAAELPEES